MRYSYSMGGDPVIKALKVGASVIANIPVMLDTNKYGQVIPVTTTGSADSLGLSLNAGTYATSLEDTVDVIVNPFAVYRAKAAGSSTAGTALSSATYHVLTQTSASTTVITATTAGTNFQGGSVFALTGANAGLSRVLTTVTSTTSITVAVAFPNSVAVGDKVLQLPWSIGMKKVQPTSTIIEADASIATGTGINCAVLGVDLDRPIDSTCPSVWVDFLLIDHTANPID